ncbi:DUF1471 domain-containing protein [Enterobacter asburiae]
MKISVITTLLISFISMNTAISAEQITHSDGKGIVGTVSASNAYTLDDLTNALSREADKQGAKCFKILGTVGNNRLYGIAQTFRECK